MNVSSPGTTAAAHVPVETRPPAPVVKAHPANFLPPSKPARVQPDSTQDSVSISSSAYTAAKETHLYSVSE